MVTPSQLKRRAELYDQLGSMIVAGVPLVKALQMAARNSALRSSRKTILRLIEHLQAGHTFSDSMTRVHGWLPEFDIALLTAGEASGRLDACFKLLARYYAARAQIIRDFIGQLTTTMATLHVFLLIFPLGLLIGLVNGQIIPFLVEKMIVFGALYGIILFFIFACQGRRGESWRSIIEFIAQSIPLFRTAQKNLVLARLTTALDALTNAGVNVAKSWELAAHASSSPRLKREIAGWEPQIEKGMTPADLVGQSHYFPEMFANLYQTGEISGQLDNTLVRLHNYYHEEGFRALQLFARIVNGIIYAAVVALVAVQIISFYVGSLNATLHAF